MRLVYLGTPEAAVPPLRALVAAGHDVALVVTRPDKKRGRGSALAPSPVSAVATELRIPVTSTVDDLLALGPRPDLGVVVAYGRIIRPHVLQGVPMVNLHFSLLPAWRGAAPVERAILAGDTETGVCLMALEEGLDTGGIYRVERVAIDPDESVEELRARLVVIGTATLVSALASGASGLGPAAPQEGEPTYAAKIESSELAIDWNRTAAHVRRTVHLGRAWTTAAGRRLIVWRTAGGELTDLLPGTVAPGNAVACGDGRTVVLVEVQPEGKSRQPAAAWFRGARLRPGTDRLNSEGAF